MFTGIVRALGKVTQATLRCGAVRLGISSSLDGADLQPGASVAVNGVCLTVAVRSGRRFTADVIPETVARTTLGKLRPGDLVNLEPSLRMGEALSGHLVQGHVDAAVPILDVLARRGDHRLRLALVPEIRRYVALKGSITLQGVSLTVAKVGAADFEVALVPVTRRETTLGKVREGERLHVEVDVLARYLERLMEPHPTGGPR